MSDDRYPFGSNYPAAPPTYPAAPAAAPAVAPTSGGLPSPVLPPTFAAGTVQSSPVPPRPVYAPPPVGLPYYAVVRPPAPSIALTLVITLFFSLFGLIPAYIHSEQARRDGYPTGKYWATFGITLGAQVMLWFIMVIGLFAVVGSGLR